MENVWWIRVMVLDLLARRQQKILLEILIQMPPQTLQNLQLHIPQIPPPRTLRTPTPEVVALLISRHAITRKAHFAMMHCIVRMNVVKSGCQMDRLKTVQRFGRVLVAVIRIVASGASVLMERVSRAIRGEE